MATERANLSLKYIRRLTWDLKITMAEEIFDFLYQQEESHDQFDHILDAALAVFIERGIKRTRIEDVAERAGLGRATVYRVIKDKNTLVKAVVAKECVRVLTEIEQQVREIPELSGRAKEGFIQVILKASKHPLLNKLIESEPETILPLLTLDGGKLFNDARKRISKYVQMVQEAEGGSISNMDPEYVAEFCLRLVQSFVLTPAGSFHRRSEKRLREFVDNTIDRMFYPIPIPD